MSLNIYNINESENYSDFRSPYIAGRGNNQLFNYF